MKIERLYAITIYLLNHGRTSASELAKYFEVSLRTIQRDIDSLCLAGIPVISIAGAAGGYEISDTFTMNNEVATQDDYSYILTALKGLVSATDDLKAKRTLEKIANIAKSNNNGIILDFSVLREGNRAVMQMLQTAVSSKCQVTFTYTNNDNETRMHNAEPIAVIYRWYSWYLLAYSKEKNDYRTYKLVRISNLQLTDRHFEQEHKPAELILQESDKTDFRRYTDIVVRCKAMVKSRVMEYLNGIVIREFANGDILMKLTVVENEQFWLGTLLSLGDNVEVLEPENVRSRLIESAEKIVSLYKKL